MTRATQRLSTYAAISIKVLAEAKLQRLKESMERFVGSLQLIFQLSDSLLERSSVVLRFIDLAVLDQVPDESHEVASRWRVSSRVSTTGGADNSGQHVLFASPPIGGLMSRMPRYSTPRAAPIEVDSSDFDV